MKPTVGRVVHYTNLGDRDGRYPPEIQAAIITKVQPSTEPTIIEVVEEATYQVSLRVFYEDGDFAMRNVRFTRAPAGSEEARGCWAWPARD